MKGQEVSSARWYAQNKRCGLHEVFAPRLTEVGMKKKTRYLAMLLMSTALVLGGCGGGANSAASQSAAEEASRLAEEEAAKAAEEAAAEASRLAEEEAARKAEEEAAAAEAALKAELEEYGIESVEEGILSEIAKACEKEDYDTVYTLMLSDEYEEEARSLEASGSDRRIVQTPHGRIGIYHANGRGTIFVGDYFIYYGEYAGDQREGDGVWIEVDSFGDYPEYHQRMVGPWKGDLPNGRIERYFSSMEGEDYHNIITVKDGLADGESVSYYTDAEGVEHENVELYRDGYRVIDLTWLEDGVTVTWLELQELEYNYLALEYGNKWCYWYPLPNGDTLIIEEDRLFDTGDAALDEELLNQAKIPGYLLGFKPFE